VGSSQRKRKSQSLPKHRTFVVGCLAHIIALGQQSIPMGASVRCCAHACDCVACQLPFHERALEQRDTRYAIPGLAIADPMFCVFLLSRCPTVVGGRGVAHGGFNTPQRPTRPRPHTTSTSKPIHGQQSAAWHATRPNGQPDTIQARTTDRNHSHTLIYSAISPRPPPLRAATHALTLNTLHFSDFNHSAPTPTRRATDGQHATAAQPQQQRNTQPLRAADTMICGEAIAGHTQATWLRTSRPLRDRSAPSPHRHQSVPAWWT